MLIRRALPWEVSEVVHYWKVCSAMSASSSFGPVAHWPAVWLLMVWQVAGLV